MPDNRDVAIFWDFENCSPSLSSQAYPIVDGIQRIAQVFGSVTKFNTYLDVVAQSRNSSTFRSDLQSSGVSIMDCPHNGKKDVVDKMILVDMLVFALDHKSPATVILIAGDRDYAYGLSIIRRRKHSVVLIVPSPNAPQSLRSQASVVIDWNHAILGKRPEVNTPPLRKFDHDLDEDTVKRLEEEIQHSNEDPAVTLMSSSLPTTIGPTHTRRESAAEPLEPSAFQRSTGSNDAFQPALSYTLNTASGVFPETPGRPRHISRASPAKFTTQSTQADIDRDSSSLFTANNALSDESGAADEYVSTANEIRNAPQYSFARPSSMSPRLERCQIMAEPSSPPSVNSPVSPSPSASHSMGSRTVPLPSFSRTRTISGGTPISYGNSPQKRASAATPSSPASTGGRSEISSAPTSVNTGSVSSMMDDSVLPSDREAVMRALGIDDEDEDSLSNESPVLVEVDDPIHAYVMNAVESCSDESRASFDRSANPSPANDGSPLTEPYGTPMSRMSSLSPIPDPSVTVSNVEMGSPQVTPVISDSSNDHSSECQAPPIESVEDRIRRLIPQQFLPLINQLLLERSKGIDKASRSTIAMNLVRSDKNVYMRAGVNRFGDYAALAERASLVLLGLHGPDGQAWIGLHPSWFQEETVPQSSTPSSPQSSSSSSSVPQAPMSRMSSLSPIPDPIVAVPNVEMGSPQATPVIGDSSNNHSSEYQTPPIESIEDKIRRLTPPRFLPLINQLLLERSKGIDKVSRSTIADALRQLDKDIYKHAGVNRFWDYTMLAEQASLIELGGREGQAWIGLHPKWFKEPVPQSPPPLSEHSSNSSASQGSIKSQASFTTTTPPPSLAPQATIPNPSTPPPADVSDGPIPSCFSPLVTCLLNVQKGGRLKPLRSTVGLILGPAVYATAGVSSLKEYLALAVEANIVELGGADGHAWVKAHPDVLSMQRSF